MSSTIPASPPPAEVARRALAAAFGPAAAGAALAPVGGGASGAFPFRAEIGGRRCLVRVEGAPSPLRNPHQYEAMRIAAAAGLAPEIFHIDEAARVAVMAFVEERPLGTFPGGPAALAAALGALARRVQATPVFPPFVDYPDIVARLWAHVRRTGLFAPGRLDPHTERLARLRAALDGLPPAPRVSSHNDPVPRNILFDGARLWLIDWESAYCNDPLVDVAILLDNLAATPRLESMLLRAWLGCEPDDPSSEGTLRARLAPVRALTRLYYAGVLLSASAAAFGAIADADLAAPTADGLRARIYDGRLMAGTPAAKHLLGKMYLAAFLDDTPPPGLDAAVR